MNNPYSSDSALNIGLLHIRSIRYKMEYIVELFNEFQLDLLCITETWLLESDTGIIEAALPKTYALRHVPRSSWMNGRGEELLSFTLGLYPIPDYHQLI